jgi:hypothetical protein
MNMRAIDAGIGKLGILAFRIRGAWGALNRRFESHRSIHTGATKRFRSWRFLGIVVAGGE